MRTLCWLGLFTLTCLAAARGSDVPALVREHVYASGAVTFRTPAGWKIERSAQAPGRLEAAGDDILLRLVYRAGESGFDSLHVACMLEHLAPRDQLDPDVRYEHDFLSGRDGPYRVLDSAFVTRYDEEARGYRVWHQRNVTVVGGGESLCIIGFVPEPLWKRSRQLRQLHDAVLSSVRLAGTQ